MAFDRNDPVQLAELKAEAASTAPIDYTVNEDGDTNKFLAEINNSDGENTFPGISKPKISAANIRSAVTYAAYDGLLGPEQSWLEWITGSNGFEEENLPVTVNLRDKLVGNGDGSSSSPGTIWAAGDDQDMEPAMLAIFDVDGSRAEVLWGFVTSISRDDWIAARSSP